MHVYIAYRNLKDHYFQNTLCGGPPINNDYRFTSVKDCIYYLLTKDKMNYAVSKEAGDKFIADVLSKCTGEHQGLFPPLCQSLDGKETAAVVEVSRTEDNGRISAEQSFYYDMDADVLLQMLDDLKSASGDPLDHKALMNYCYPNAVLPEGDFELVTIYHGIYCKPDNTSNSVIQTVFPDKRSSHFWIRKDGLSVEIRDGDNEVTYDVPSDLLPEIKDKVRQLCKEPAEAYAEHGDWEGFIRFGKKEERIFTDPDKTLALLKEIASRGSVLSTEAVDTNKYYSVNKLPTGFSPLGFGMMGILGNMNMNTPAPNPSNTADTSPSDRQYCQYCGADVTGKKFCTECGGKVE